MDSNSIESELNALKEKSLFRSLKWVQTAQGAEISLNGNSVVNFASNDYLGLANHPLLKEAMIEGVERWGVGSAASRLITGSMEPHLLLEQRIAKLKQSEASLCFSTGYATAVGAVTALVGKGDTVILDKLTHASLIDGARLSGATIRVFPHNGLEKLEKLLKGASEKPGRTLVITESVFSMDGDLAELEKIIALKNKYGAWLLLDEAHGLGVFGENGGGLSEALGCSHEIDIQMGTLGKSAGVSGGYIAASQSIIDLLVNKSRSFIYSTAPPPAVAFAAYKAVILLSSEEGRTRRQRLKSNIDYLAKTLSIEAKTPIIPWHVGKSEQALTLMNDLLEVGIFTPAIRYPTVPPNTARLRITLTANHSKEQIALLAGQLKHQC